jgi:hypothetical protein
VSFGGVGFYCVLCVWVYWSWRCVFPP